jgi:hypothetical protein
MGYHKRKIEKGVIGEYSKVKEEFEELTDAFEQDCKGLIICELTDLVGAIEEYAKKFNLTLADLKQFSDLTKSAFQEGKRK